MRMLPWHRLAAVIFSALLGLGSAHAQSWSVTTLLRDSGADTFTFQTAQGEPVAEVPRVVLERSSEVLHRLSAEYAMTPPELVVTASAAPNAYSNLGSGRPVVGLSTGMLRISGGREVFLAAIVAHELGHLHARHAPQRQEAAALAAIGAVLGAAVDIAQFRKGRSTYGAGMVLGAVGGGLLQAKFTRDQEREADRLGAEAMARAGYDPGEAVALWRSVASATPGGDGQWLDTHPSHAEREAEMALLARELAPVVEANRGKAAAQARPVHAAAMGERALEYLTAPPRDPAKARALAERAAQAGDPLGKAVYGTVLREGLAGEADGVRGLQLLQEAAAAGVPWAHYQLGVAYRLGQGVPRDRERALWHLDAAAATVIEAQDLRSRIRAEHP